MIPSRNLYALLYLFLSTHIVVEALDLTDAQIDVVSYRLTESAKLSWELGTRAQTILERNATSYSVFSRQPLPPPSNPDAATLLALQPLFDIANNLIWSQSNIYTVPRPLIPDESAGDPASLCVCVLIANLTSAANGGATSGMDYAAAAKSQIDYLFSAVPRTWDGALSHRVPEVQLWSDFVYMVPPCLAYYGVTTRDRGMVLEAYNQIRLYRNYLRDPGLGMWRHILLGQSWNDPGFWSTGNGWAAAGMLRVYATILNSEYGPSLTAEMGDLANWVREIHAAMYSRLDTTYLFTNYADRPADSPGNFYDAASTALLASTVYRAAQFLGQTEYLSYAEKSRQAISAPKSPTLLFAYAHFTADGVLGPVVDPHVFTVSTPTMSPEGQAFVVQMYAAWKDWQNESKQSGPTINAGSGSTDSGSTPDSGSKETGQLCATIGNTSGCTALISGISRSGSAALVTAKRSYLLPVVLTMWGLVCTFV